MSYNFLHSFASSYRWKPTPVSAFYKHMLQSHCIYDYAELTETCTFSLITLNDLFKTYDKEITGILTTSSKTFISTFAVRIILTFTRFPNILEEPVNKLRIKKSKNTCKFTFH